MTADARLHEYRAQLESALALQAQQALEEFDRVVAQSLRIVRAENEAEPAAGFAAELLQVVTILRSSETCVILAYPAMREHVEHVINEAASLLLLGEDPIEIVDDL